MRVLVLAGGPDAERAVSIESASAVARALRESGRCDVVYEEVGRLTPDRLRELGSGARDEVVFPVLHGPWGEGGGVQRLLEEDGRPFVGTGSRGATAAMDKVRTKQLAAQLGVRVLDTALLDPDATHGPPFPLPVIAKPVCQGSSIGMHACRTVEEWERAVEAARGGSSPVMVEPMLVGAREFTVGLVDLGASGVRRQASGGLSALPVVEIVPERSSPSAGLYDYGAKYERDDTRYVVDPGLPGGVGARASAWTATLAHALRVRHLCRADFLLDDEGRAVFLELNTMPGFTSHSLLPLAASASGLAMPALCAGLAARALRDALEPAGTA